MSEILVSDQQVKAVREILVRVLNVAEADADRILAKKDGETAAKITTDEFTSEGLPLKINPTVPAGFHSALFRLFEQTAKMGGEKNAIDNAGESQTLREKVRSLLTVETTVLYTTTKLAEQGKIETAIHRERLADVIKFLNFSRYPQRGTDEVELRRNLLTLRVIRDFWPRLKKREVIFQRLSDESCGEHAAIAYLPFPPREVWNVIRKIEDYEQWVPFTLQSNPVGRDKYERDLFDMELHLPGLPNRNWRQWVRHEFENEIGGSAWGLNLNGNMNANFGKWYVLPAAGGGSIVIRRGMADGSLLPDSFACGVGREKVVESFSALANRTMNPAWKKAADEDDTDYGSQRYTTSDDLLFDWAP